MSKWQHLGVGQGYCIIPFTCTNLSSKNMNSASKPDLRVDPLVFGCLAAAKILLHLWFNPRYGLHRDEYLYLAEARHLDWGYLEVPPFTPFVGRIALWLGGDISVVRFFPALAGAVTLWAILALVRTFGGGRQASWLAGLAFLFSVSFLGSNVLYQPVSFTQMWWALISLFAAWAVYYAKPKYWILFGIGMGLAWLTKYTIAVFGFSLFLGLLLTPQRKVLGERPFWLSIGLAALMAMPNVFWQFAHDLPVLRHIDRNLVKWVKWKYKKKGQYTERARRWLGQVASYQPGLFAHWRLGAPFPAE